AFQSSAGGPLVTLGIVLFFVLLHVLWHWWWLVLLLIGLGAGVWGLLKLIQKGEVTVEFPLPRRKKKNKK
ncbi:hypothetical protein COW95_00350, partial [Candidatus Peregrinibacteria bacterium CG22_combo_CG10-13_8_21_14_all_49_11]